MDFTFQLTDTHLVVSWLEPYHDRFTFAESKRLKQHKLPLLDAYNLYTFLKEHSEEIDRLLRHSREEEKQRLQSELFNITSRLKTIST